MGSHKRQTACNGFYIPYVFYLMRDFRVGGTRKRNKMKRIAYPEKFLQERTGDILGCFPIRIAHTGRRIQNQNKINWFRRLTRNEKDNPQEQQQKIRNFFHKKPIIHTIHPAMRGSIIQNPRYPQPQWILP
jgi:hypothetical protein